MKAKRWVVVPLLLLVLALGAWAVWPGGGQKVREGARLTSSPAPPGLSAVEQLPGRAGQELLPDVAARAGSTKPPAGAVAQDSAEAKSAWSGPLTGGDTAPDLASVADRKIVYNARLDLTVEDVGDSIGQVWSIATAAGGFVAQSNTYEQKEGHKAATIVIQVPSVSYQQALSQLRRLAREVKGESSGTRDVTEEYSDLGARLRNLQATEGRYLELLALAKTIPEILQLQDRINTTRLEIERVRGRMNLLEHLSDLATIQVELRPFVPATTPPSEGFNPATVAQRAWEASLVVLQGLASAAIVAAIVVAWLVLPFGVGLVLWRWARGRPLPGS
ncbi:MAG TPA: DUF4349 domain-containing protein [Dehalococcoidia bacterium]|nr:DUF4349 domain-containing protein [Dehalococcoidia bacterium]